MKRTITFVYGIACYAIFFATFLYAIGFIGNVAVPTTLDGPRSGPISVAIVIDLALLGLFAVQHSVMARPWFKAWWTRIVPVPAERSTYVLLSSLALILLFWLWRPIGIEIMTIHDSRARFAIRALFAFGWALILVSTFLIDHFDLFGLRQVWLNLKGLPYEPPPFRTPGPYRLVRHPLYVGWLLVFWMTPSMTGAHLLFALMTTAYILIAIQFEERDLVRFHGREYQDYQERVPMLVPFSKGGSPAQAVDEQPIS